VSAARVPVSTYRLQFNSRFTFRDARAIVDYLNALGVSDAYASSYLKAVPGSPHGYDVVDPTCLNPDIGTDEDYWAWVEALRGRGMGHILDIVPNHMGIAKSANPWWLDVLENGPSSRFARFFDIEWNPVKDELADKVLIPILGDQYGDALERQELHLAFRDGRFVVTHYDDVLPIAPDTYGRILSEALDAWVAAHPGDAADELEVVLAAADKLPPRSTRDPNQIALRARDKEVVKRRFAALAASSEEVRALIDDCVAQFNGVAGQPRSFDRLDRLLNEQSYRLAHWRVASEEINYRRFFDVNQLAALRMEDPEVFDEVHRFAFDLVRRGGPSGLRIDHVDGLYSPGEYLRRLQQNLSTTVDDEDIKPAGQPAVTSASPVAASFYIVVEKILGADERLPADWPVAGTTGYEFAALVNNLFVDGRNEAALDAIYQRFVRDRRDRPSFAELAYRSKKQVLHETMSGDINSLGHQLNRFSERHRHFRDFTLYSLISTLKEVIACFPVYRTYVSPGQPISAHDRRYVTEAVSCAKHRSPAVTSLVFDFVKKLLLHETTLNTPDQSDDLAKFTGKFQQLTSPVAAKGIEDTALYVYNRLLSLNEVGGDPTRFGLAPAIVHERLAERHQRWPLALSATATHDTKRGEDMRARLNVLSELPGAWKMAVTKWRALNRRFKTDVKGTLAPGGNEEYFLYQTLVCAWPFDADGDDAIARFRDRISEYMTKALREAKVHTSWLSPDEEYEKAVTRFVAAILDRGRSAPFLDSCRALRSHVAELGIYNGLAQVLIKITAPGVPDFYQGTEFWDLNLVDPDNRRPVDYEKRREALTAFRGCATALPQLASQLLEHRADGRVKLFVTTRALTTRTERRGVYERGEYVPLTASGSLRDHVFAFARCLGSDVAITCVPRLLAPVVADSGTPPIGSVWGDARLDVSTAVNEPGIRLRDVFTGTTIEADETRTIPLATVFERFPLALLVTERSAPSRPSRP
jgi:(1->4)-alpha-D-glucan 1-alpha-D-glucosylmutase